MRRSAKPWGTLMAIATAFSLLMTFGPLTSEASRATVASAAFSAKAFSLRESAHLHLTSKHGFTLNEQGVTSGTLTGKIYVHLRIVSTSRVAAEVSIYPRGSSISGYASAQYQRGTEAGSFAGSMSISRGTGRYRHAHGSGLSFTGTIKRSNDAITVYVSGMASD
jgi:hypothetical protein